MKLLHSKLELCICLLALHSGWVGVATAQLGDDDSSAAFIATQCAVSSGGTSEQYLAYAMSLSKTMGEISAVDQEEIFGYVPKPSGAAAENVDEELQQLLSDLEEEGEDGGDDEDDDGEGSDSRNSFWERVKEFFENLFGG